MKGAEILLNTLKEQGTEVIYGIVGREAEAILFNEVKGIDFILTRDERSASFMADMHGRITGKAGVCFSTFGPGATNLVTGIASAYLDRSPMLAISAQLERRNTCACVHQYVDQETLMRPVVKYSKEIRNIENLKEEIVHAVMIAEQGLPGPCYLSIPLDMLQESCACRQLKTTTVNGCCVLESDERTEFLKNKRNQLEEFTKFLRQSRHPVVIVGGNFFSGQDLKILEKILDALNIPAFTTYSGKGKLSCNHKCYMATVSKYLDCFRPGTLKEIFEMVDSIMLVGFDMVEGVGALLWDYGPSKKICALNSIIKNDKSFIPADIELAQPYNKVLELITGSIDKKFFADDELNKLKVRINTAIMGIGDKGFGLGPFAVVREIRKILSRDDVIVSDVGMHKQFISLFYDIYKTESFFCSNGLASMGFALPAAIATKKNLPDRRIVAICGDAGFHLSSHELETSVRAKLPVICLVFHDASVGLIRHYQKKGFNATNSRVTDFGTINFSKLAIANGCRGYKVSTLDGLKSALIEALDIDLTTVIEIILDKKSYDW